MHADHRTQGEPMRFISAFLYGLAMLLVAGCASVPMAFEPAVPLDNKNGRRGIGVISTIGGKFVVQKVGMTAFGNERNEVAIPSWGIDDLVATKLKALLAGKAEVRKIAAPEEAFAAYQAPGGLFRDHNAELKDALRKLTAGQSFDTLLVVVGSVSPFGNTNQHIGGLGIVQSSSIVASYASVHAIFQVRVYDGRTLEFQGWKSATTGQGTFLSTIKGPHKEVDMSWWPEPGKAEGDVRLKAVVREMVEQALATTLPEVLALAPAKR
jgi:hypothetical protein